MLQSRDVRRPSSKPLIGLAQGHINVGPMKEVSEQVKVERFSDGEGSTPRSCDVQRPLMKPFKAASVGARGSSSYIYLTSYI